MKKRRDMDRMIEGKDTETERDTDVTVTDLRGIDNLRIAAPGVIKCEQPVGQYHQPAAKPAQMFRTNKAGMDSGKPIHQPVGADVNGISADGKESQVERQHPTERFILAHVAFQDFEDMETLPEQEQAYEHQTVPEIELAIAGHGPNCASEKHNCRQRQQQREPIDLMFFLDGLFLLRFSGGQDIHAPKDGWKSDEQGHVGDVVYQRIGQDFFAGAAFGAEHEGENQIAHA